MPASTPPAAQTAAVPVPFKTVLLAWLIPGAGHFLQGRRGRGALLAACVLLAFAIGLLMRGPLYQPGAAGATDALTRLINWGGFAADLASGLPYLAASWAGYAAPDVPTHASDYGSKFLVAAGLLNILAIVDAYEIATKQKD